MPKYISGREIISSYDIKAFELAALCKEIPALSSTGKPVRDPVADPLKLPRPPEAYQLDKLYLKLGTAPSSLVLGAMRPNQPPFPLAETKKAIDKLEGRGFRRPPADAPRRVEDMLEFKDYEWDNLKEPNNKRLDYWFLREDVVRFVEEKDIPLKEKKFNNPTDHNIAPESPIPPVTKQHNDERRTGGKPPGSLREAVEHVYEQLYEKGEILILQPGKINEFINHLRDCTIENNRNFSEYVAERVKNVKKGQGQWIIITQERVIKDGQSIEIKQKSCNYNKNGVAKILTTLRKIYPLET